MAGAAGEFSDYIGKQTSAGTVVVERSPVSQFAHAVHAEDPVFLNVDVARADGFDDVPAPPTFGFALQHWGKWDELQPAGAGDTGNPMREVMGQLMASGGIVLHGEQEFTYHRPVVCGQRLHYEGVVRDIYRKASGDKTMTFLVIEDTYRDDDGEPVLTSTMNLLHRV
ncbi:MAG: FAS1-like dehydratase domain-containing protein [Acidimicrobiales bacterium]